MGRARRSRLAFAARGKLCQQFGQQRQNIAPHAVDVHAQRQTEPGCMACVDGFIPAIRAGFCVCKTGIGKILPFRLHVGIKAVGACNPVVQPRLGSDDKASALQTRKAIVQPLKPWLLLRV